MNEHSPAADTSAPAPIDAHLQAALERDNAQPHLEGGSKLDAALIGQAGRPEFARLGQEYKGLGGELA